jgi:hypothetical protein
MTLNLTDPQIVEQLKAVDVTTNTPTDLTPDAQEVERKIRTIKDCSYSLKLTPDQVEMLSRFAAVKGLDWKAYLTSEIQQQILKQEGHIGKPLISGPSFASGATKVTGPSLGGLVNRG